MRHALVLALAVCAAGCADSLANEDGELVERLRVLAVRAESPELAPGESTRLTPLVMSPTSNPALTYAWFACDPALDDFNGTVCSDDDRLQDLASLVKDPRVHPLGTGAGATYTAPATLFDGRAKDDPVRYYGVPAELLLVVSSGTFEDAAAGRVESQVALVRVYVSEIPAGVRNENPVLQEVSVDGQPVRGDDVAEVGPTASLSLVTTANSAQEFIEIDPTRPEGYITRPEGLAARWFTTSGAFAKRPGEDPGPPDVKDRAPTLETTSAAEIAVVLRDGRGGCDFRRFRVRR